MAKREIEPRDVAFAAGGMAIAMLLGLAVFIISGVYNVSAARPHLDPTVWLLDLLRHQSIAFHSRSIEVPPLDDERLVRLGALHFAEGCAGCHGAPGRPANAITGAMLPEPPALPETMEEWSTAELFWIVQNGQKYTGMPAWIAPERVEEVWSVVAFLKQMKALDGVAYGALVGAGDGVSATVPFSVGRSREFPQLVAYCEGCHGETGAAPVAEAVPTIGGQSVSYLVRALKDYRSGARDSGFMEFAASALTDAEIEALAEHFGGPFLSPRQVGEADEEAVRRGATIFAAGLPEADVPACISCHDNGAERAIPRLLGQSAAFVTQQLQLWQDGIRGQTGHEAIMAPVARRLTPQQIEDVARFIASTGAPAGEGS